MNFRMLSVAGALAATVAAGGIAAAQTTPIAPQFGQMQPNLRGPHGSDQNLRRVRRRLEGVIDQLQRDQHDYSGHRISAIRDLEQARQEIDAALQADQSH